ncbi:MAG: hypothetical protein ACI36W_03830 [Coriobacteriales bacterium]
MTIALRGRSAFELWRGLALFEARSIDERQRRWELGDFTHDELPLLSASNVIVRGRQHLPADYSLCMTAEDAGRIARHYGLSLPLSVQIIEKGARRHTAAVSSRLLPIPGSPQFFLLEPGVFVASPELALFDLAASMEEEALLLAACELCSLYSPDPVSGALLERPQLAQKRLLLDLAEQMSGARGSKCARFVANALVERSRSPRESQLALLLSLPCTRGGYGLPKPLLNHPVELSSAAAAIYGRPLCECDLFFKDAGLAVFYDSEDTHLSTRQQHNDALRHNALSTTGITELSVTNSQIRSLSRMDALAGVIATACGKRHATTVKNYRARQVELRRKLLGA